MRRFNQNMEEVFEKVYKNSLREVYMIVKHSFSEEDERMRCMVKVYSATAKQTPKLEQMQEHEIRKWILHLTIEKINKRQRSIFYRLKKKDKGVKK